MLAEIISVGDELLRGYVVNTNTAFLAQRLMSLGYDVRYQSVIGDNAKDIFDAVRTAVSRSHVTVFTGGLGPTEDDMTKEMVAKAIGIPLVRDEESANRIMAYFNASGRQMPESNLKQSMILEGSTVLANSRGTAPGIAVQKGKQMILLLPGPPREMEPMFDEAAAPLLRRFHTDICASRTLRLVGIGESSVEQSIRPLLYGENPHAALYVETGEVKVKIFAKADTAEKAAALCDELAGKIRGVLGSYIYAEDEKPIWEVVCDQLKQRQLHLAIAESCTGGMMAERLTSVQGASEVLEFGMAAYADWVKKHNLSVDRSVIRRYTAVSSVTAAEMAKGARAAGKADIGVGITGIAGPGNGGYENKQVGLVYIAVCDASRVVVKKFRFGNRPRDFIRELATKNAFEMVRRFIAGLEIPDSRTFRKNELADLESSGKTKTKTSVVAKRSAVSMLGIFLLSGMIYSGFLFLHHRADQSVYNYVRTVYAESAASGDTLGQLRTLNADTAGWLSIDSLGIDTVIVEGEDNTHYLTHDFDGRANRTGCLFFDSRIDINRAEYLDNLVIYGSSSDRSRMFGPLHSLSDEQSLRGSLSFTLNANGTVAEYRIFSVGYATAEEGDCAGLTDVFEFADKDDFVQFAVAAKMQSIWNIDLSLNYGDQFLTMVTDSSEWDGAKLVVIARRVREGESAALPEISRNQTVIYPDEWYEKYGSVSFNRTVIYDTWVEWLTATGAESSGTMGETESGNWGLSGIESEDPTINSEIDYSEEKDTPDLKSDENVIAYETTIQVTNSLTGEIVTDTPYNIVCEIVEAEIGSSFHPEAIKAQAVAAITMLRYQFENGETAPAFPLRTASETVRECVDEVINEALYYNGSIIFSPYFSSAAGRTNNSSDVWVQDLPYLVTVESEYDNLSGSYAASVSYTRDEVRRRIEDYYGITLSEDPNAWLQIVDYTTGGYTGTVLIDGQRATTGSILRYNCLELRSAAFTVSYDPATETFLFNTSGYGHGVGLSQWGAHYYALKEGWDYEDILTHYYTGVELGGVSW